MARTLPLLCLLAGIASAAGCSTAGAQTTPCFRLTSSTSTDFTIVSADNVPAGSFTVPPDPESKTPSPKALVPDFCRVIAVARPSPDSAINFEVWMPAPANWNKKFEGVGNGGYTGRISYGPLVNALNAGYATASSDTGHTGSDLKFAVGHPEKIIDWGFRATHITAAAAKQILRLYFGKFPDHSYFNGCSTGGEQALSEAQRFPEDYDGIIAGDAGNDRVHLNVGFLWSFAATHKDGEILLPASALELVHKAALAACATTAGIEDGIIADPLHCKFDPATLLCHDNNLDACLTKPQVEAVQKVYDGPHNPRTGEQIIAGWSPGSELVAPGDYTGWSDYIIHGKEPARLDFWKYWVFNDPNWDWRTFDFDKDVAYADQKMAAANASSPDLHSFQSRGGKLLMYHGWVDPVGPPRDAIDYYEKVAQTTGGVDAARQFFRLYLVPGMSHCNGGPGYLLAGGARGVDDPNDVPKTPHPNSDNDVLSALDRWVTLASAPESIIASHQTAGAIDRTIPVCAYPATARPLKGSSSTDAASFRCVEDRPH